MRLYKEDILKAVAHKAEKYAEQEGFANFFSASNTHRGYMDALVAYADHIKNLKYGAFVDYDFEQKHLDRMRNNLVYTGANCRYNRGYKAGCLALKSILSRLKAEKEVQKSG